MLYYYDLVNKDYCLFQGSDNKISQSSITVAMAIRISCLLRTCEILENLRLFASLLSSKNGITIFNKSGTINAISLITYEIEIIDFEIDFYYGKINLLDENVLPYK